MQKVYEDHFLLVLCFTSLLLLLLDGNYWMFNVWIASHSNAFEFSRWDWKVQLTRGNACLPTLTEVSVLTFQLLADASVSGVGLKTTARTQSKALSLSLDSFLGINPFYWKGEHLFLLPGKWCTGEQRMPATDKLLQCCLPWWCCGKSQNPLSLSECCLRDYKGKWKQRCFSKQVPK